MTCRPPQTTSRKSKNEPASRAKTAKPFGNASSLMMGALGFGSPNIMTRPGTLRVAGFMSTSPIS